MFIVLIGTCIVCVVFIAIIYIYFLPTFRVISHYTQNLYFPNLIRELKGREIMVIGNAVKMQINLQVSQCHSEITMDT